ncbi:hypothetical protein C8R43DRAFT_958085 [Mycena crocata]|nr:hypothetical protein C8R43DRAFT_958085 [Mycena crocata]
MPLLQPVLLILLFLLLLRQQRWRYKRLIFNLHFEDFRPCLIHAFSNLEHIDSHIGRAIREYHSPIGILDQAWETIIDNTIICNSCQCYYSLNGYNLHVVDNFCTMASSLFVVCPILNPDFPTVSMYPNGYIIPHMEDFLDTPSGVAFMKWNSRIGVPTDVWALLATSSMKTSICYETSASNSMGSSLVL